MTPREPPRFADRWLRFDPQRPTRPRLLRRLMATMIGMLIVCAALAMLSGRLSITD